MKYETSFIRILLFTVVLSITACTTTVDKINDLVDDTLRQSENMTEEEWNDRNMELEKLLRQYNAEQDSFTEEEKQSIDYALGQYYGAQVKENIMNTKQGIQDFLNQLPGFINGFIDGSDLNFQTDSL